MRAFNLLTQSPARLTRLSPIPSSRRRQWIHSSRRQPHDTAELSSSAPEEKKGVREGQEEEARKSKANGQEGLPAPGASGPVLDVSGEGTTVKLDELGPLVVNTNGTVGRVANWREMTAMEKETTLRLLSKRNKARLEALQSNKSGETDK